MTSLLFVCVCVFVSLVAYFYYTTPNIGVLYIYNNNNDKTVHSHIHNITQLYFFRCHYASFPSSKDCALFCQKYCSPPERLNLIDSLSVYQN